MDKSMILIRTSTKEQNPQLQLDECKEFNSRNNWECINVFEKKESAYKNEEGVWKDEIEWAKSNQVKHIIVWNMDRYSRLEPEKVLNEVKILSVVHNIQIHAVNGDSWSEIVESVGKLKELGFIGQALSEFLEKLLRGLEFHRANMESKVKSERVKLAIRKEDGKPTRSYKGKLWGFHSVGKNTDKQIIESYKQGKKFRDIIKEIFYWDKNNNKKYVSLGYVHKVISKFRKENNSLIQVQEVVN